MLIEALAGVGVLAVVSGSLWMYRAGRRKTETAPDVSEIPEHILVLSGGRAHLSNLVALSKRFPNSETRVLVTELGLCAQRIYDNLEQDPRDLSVIRNFVDYHMPKCVELASEHLRILGEPASPERESVIADSSRTMQEMKTTFDAFYQKCLENDTTGLAVLSETLRRVGSVERPVPREQP